jgi:hypothetical protein
MLTVLNMVFGLTTAANATLWDRGNGLIYDDVLNITWLQDANYAMTSGTALPCGPGAPECDPARGLMPWDQAMEWAAQLEYGGYTGWRLPDAHNQDGSGPDAGNYVTTSEMGHLFFNDLGGVPGTFPGADFIDGNGKLVSFLLPSWGDTWWLGDEWAGDTNSAWYFVIGYGESSGHQHGMEKWRARLAWAVHDGDIGAAPEPVRVPIDIKPQSCPNPINVKSQGVLPVAVLGTAAFDVTTINPVSIRVAGVPALRWALEDVASPFTPLNGEMDAYSCAAFGRDGIKDLTLKLDTQQVAAALGDVHDGDVLLLPLTGHLLNGTPIQGQDVVVILKKGKE